MDTFIPRYRRLVLLIVLLITLSGLSCDQGLSPGSTAPYGLRGVVKFKHWPPVDSVLDLRIAVLQHYPVQNIPGEVLAGRARYGDKLPYGVDSVSYTITLAPLPTGIIPFVGVAQRYGPDIQNDWRVVGEYYVNGDSTKPGTVHVPPDSIIGNINIDVDFLNLPPQP